MSYLIVVDAVKRFRTHISHWYLLLCDIVSSDLKPELRSAVRRIFLRIGPVFGIYYSGNGESYLPNSSIPNWGSDWVPDPCNQGLIDGVYLDVIKNKLLLSSSFGDLFFILVETQ
ncbi:hypothetical protein QYM36_018913 [Artemia franciscana]|uniref:Uncharacterized protein n=1 Tax=Artemia franciscana TaxID=6661 RepID=A0AA88KTH8_ARTSF|nr:hypothetical protein QYM36_018913 [Artemia franciscana]